MIFLHYNKTVILTTLREHLENVFENVFSSQVKKCTMIYLNVFYYHTIIPYIMYTKLVISTS